MERQPEASNAEAAAREQLRRIAAELEGIRFRLLGVHTSLAATSREDLLLTGHPPTGISVEIVSAVECVLIDRIGPALKSIQEVIQEERAARSGEGSR